MMEQHCDPWRTVRRSERSSRGSATSRLLARTVVEGFINGLHRAPFFGASIDFAEHRGYVAGDDIRRVDWRLYARTDRYYVKACRPTPTPTSRSCSTSRDR